MHFATLTSIVLSASLMVAPSWGAPSSLALLAVAATYPNPIALKGSFDTHDPSALCKDSKGTYFYFSTGGGIGTHTSTDRINWKSVGSAFSSAPWILPYTGGVLDIWAPDCKYVNGVFHLYYTAATWGKEINAIFYATSTTGLPGSWKNNGLVMLPTADYSAVDPTPVIDGSNWWLSFGSGLKGIYLAKLNPSTGLRADNTTYHLAQKSGVEEGSSLVHVGSYYYLLVSVGGCCDGANSTYHVLTGRSKSITGPYLDESGKDMLSGGGTTILASHDSVHGPGGQSIYQDTDGWIIDYHYYPNTGGSLLGINHLDFSSGWPVVKA